MRRANRSQPRAVSKSAILACGCAGIAAGVAGGCLTAPPPDLPPLPHVRPTALHDAVSPAEGLILEWPTEFSVPVQLSTPTDPYFYNIFLDSNPATATVKQTAPDGGIALVTFIAPQPDTATCPHHLEFIVAHGFVDAQRRQWDDVGGDIVNWYFYNSGPGGPQGCPVIDAGTGGFPEASVDALPIPPEAGGDP